MSLQRNLKKTFSISFFITGYAREALDLSKSQETTKQQEVLNAFIK